MVAMMLWLDDERDPREWLPHMSWFRGREDELDHWIWAKTASEGIAALRDGGITEVSLDHDLGSEEIAGSGYDVLLWIEQRTATDDEFVPPIIHVHTSNSGARDRMEGAVKGIAHIVERRRRT